MLVETQNCLDTLKDTLAVSHKTKHTFSIQTSSFTSWNIYKRVFEKYIIPPKNLYVDFYDTFAYFLKITSYIFLRL